MKRARRPWSPPRALPTAPPILPLFALLLGCDAGLCPDPVTATQSFGDDEFVRAAGEDGVLQDAECRRLCEAWVPTLATLEACAVEDALTDDNPFDTATPWGESRYTLSCTGRASCR